MRWMQIKGEHVAELGFKRRRFSPLFPVLTSLPPLIHQHTVVSVTHSSNAGLNGFCVDKQPKSFLLKFHDRLGIPPAWPGPSHLPFAFLGCDGSFFLLLLNRFQTLPLSAYVIPTPLFLLLRELYFIIPPTQVCEPHPLRWWVGNDPLT